MDFPKYARNQWDGLGALLWLSADLRDEWRKLDAIDRHVRPVGSVPLTETGEQQGSALPQGASPAPNTWRSLLWNVGFV